MTEAGPLCSDRLRAMSGTTALLLGATGLIGREILTLLLRDASFLRVVVVARRSTGVVDPRLEEHVFDLEEMEHHPALFRVDQIFCALGTTMRQAGSRERFRAVDYHYPLVAASLGLQNGVRHFFLVSSSSANPRSRIFYSRVKGEVERDVRALGYPALTIARPSFLLGQREETRLAERVITTVGGLLPRRVKPIAAADVAAALVAEARQKAHVVRILRSDEMQNASAD